MSFLFDLQLKNERKTKNSFFQTLVLMYLNDYVCDSGRHQAISIHRVRCAGVIESVTSSGNGMIIHHPLALTQLLMLAVPNQIESKNDDDVVVVVADDDEKNNNKRGNNKQALVAPFVPQKLQFTMRDFANNRSNNRRRGRGGVSFCFFFQKLLTFFKKI